MDICKFCDKECKNLSSHVRAAHQMDMEAYNEMSIEDFNALQENFKEKEIEETKVIDDTDSKYFTNRKLSDILKQYKLTEDELINVIKNYKFGDSIPIAQQQKIGTERNEVIAESLSIKDAVETTELGVAELLTKYYGFKVIDVTTKGGTMPKIWVLRKRKV